ncbi:MAG TPA: hypothetical protein QF641_02605 [Candidatus Thalassarchaeaceae archaeon]|nr:hypothetical protein [Candidatus Thalassarchaeaceae archaeon]
MKRGNFQKWGYFGHIDKSLEFCSAFESDQSSRSSYISLPLRMYVEGDLNEEAGFRASLEEMYQDQIEDLIKKESQRIVLEKTEPSEISRLQSLSLIDLFENNDESLIPALMARLGPVRAALDGHGGALVVSQGEVEEFPGGRRALSLVLDLDGACVSCGAAPGTLKGIQDDLLVDIEVSSIRFTSEMLEWFDDIQRDFVLKFGGVTFV